METWADKIGVTLTSDSGAEVGRIGNAIWDRLTASESVPVLKGGHPTGPADPNG